MDFSFINSGFLIGCVILPAFVGALATSLFRRPSYDDYNNADLYALRMQRFDYEVLIGTIIFIIIMNIIFMLTITEYPYVI